MYQPPHFKEDRLEVLHQLIHTHPFGLLVSHGPGGLQANGLPFHLNSAAAPNGVLLAHMARANPQWRELQGRGVLVIFQGPQAYVSPSLYETKRETGKVVPTWNYVMVQARGRAEVHEDEAWLASQIRHLTKAHEEKRAAPWAVEDAPEPYIASQMKGIVGVEIRIAALEGKWKMSQNRPAADRQGVAQGIEPAEVAALVRAASNLTR
jgi:transcriptional regulator